LGRDQRSPWSASRSGAAGDDGIPLREIAQSIGDHLGLPADFDKGNYFITTATLDNQ
jgi:hypothetical protein